MLKKQQAQTTGLLFKITLIAVHIIGLFLILTLVANVLVGVYHALIGALAVSLEPLFLFVVPTVTLLLAAGVIFLKQPVHNLLCLITIFFTTVLLYLYVGAEFLAFLFLIVYVGAIAILFLFVIMLLHLKELTTVPATLTNGVATLFLPSVILAIVGIDDILSTSLSTFFVISDSLAFSTESSTSDALIWFVNNRFLDILTFSAVLYTYHSFLFFLSSLLLLTAMLGAIILATSSTDNVVGRRSRARFAQWGFTTAEGDTFVF